MKLPITLISTFVIFNLFIGRLFQESLNVTCFSELSIIALTSFTFWGLSAKTVKKTAHKFNAFKNPKHFLLHGGIGISSSIVNILLGHVFIVLLMVYVYKCTSPSFNFLNASLTNNIAVNLLCYFSLVFYYLNTENQVAQKDDELTVQTLKKDYTGLLSLSLGNVTKVVHIDKIKFIEASNNCIIIYTDVGKFVKYQSLKSFLSENHTNIIQRVHRSYAVNINKIDSVKKNKNGDGVITLENDQTVKLSRNYKLGLAT